jgi:N-acetyl-gamma-glutamylphosphate reductase
MIQATIELQPVRTVTFNQLGIADLISGIKLVYNPKLFKNELIKTIKGAKNKEYLTLKSELNRVPLYAKLTDEYEHNYFVKVVGVSKVSGKLTFKVSTRI